VVVICPVTPDEGAPPQKPFPPQSDQTDGIEVLRAYRPKSHLLSFFSLLIILLGPYKCSLMRLYLNLPELELTGSRSFKASLVDSPLLLAPQTSASPPN